MRLDEASRLVRQHSSATQIAYDAKEIWEKIVGEPFVELCILAAETMKTGRGRLSKFYSLATKTSLTIGQNLNILSRLYSSFS